MSRSYRGILEKLQHTTNGVLDNILVDLTEVHRIITTIRDEDVTDETIDKIDEIEYIVGNLMNELE